MSEVGRVGGQLSRRSGVTGEGRRGGKETQQLGGEVSLPDTRMLGCWWLVNLGIFVPRKECRPHTLLNE